MRPAQQLGRLVGVPAKQQLAQCCGLPCPASLAQEVALGHPSRTKLCEHIFFAHSTEISTMSGSEFRDALELC